MLHGEIPGAVSTWKTKSAAVRRSQLSIAIKRLHAAKMTSFTPAPAKEFAADRHLRQAPCNAGKPFSRHRSIQGKKTSQCHAKTSVSPSHTKDMMAERQEPCIRQHDQEARLSCLIWASRFSRVAHPKPRRSSLQELPSRLGLPP